MMKEVRVAQMFVRFAARRTGLHGLTLSAALSARPAHAASFGDWLDKAQDAAGRAVDRGFEFAVWLMDQATDVAIRFNDWAMVMLDKVGMGQKADAWPANLCREDRKGRLKTLSKRLRF